MINLTPHAVVLLVEDPTGDVAGTVGYGPASRAATFRVAATIPSSGIARATTTTVLAGLVEVDGHTVPVNRTTYGAPEGLPAPDGGTLLVVSPVTAQAAQAAGRPVDDLLVVGDLVRDENGKPIGCTGLGRL